MKQKCSFILKASTALVLALLMLFGTVTTSLAAVVDNAATGADADVAETGWTINGGKVYFDASSITVDSTHKLQICIYGTDTNDYNRDCAHFESLSKVEGTDSIYYAQVNGIGSKMNNPWGLCFFTAGTTWGDYNADNCNDPDVQIYTNNIKKNAAWYSDTYGTDLSSGNTYFINPASSSNGAGLTVGTSVPSSFSYNQTAKVSIKAVGASSYTTKNSSNTSTGGTLKITGKVWSSKAVANSSTTASNYSASMNSAVKSSYAKLTTTTYSGYTFDGWYSTNTGTGTQYTTTTGYKVTGATTTYGRYSENANTVTFTKKLGSSAATNITTKSAGVTTKASYTAPDETGYTFTGWTITSGSSNATNVTGTGSASSATVSLNATGAVTVQATYEEAGTCGFTLSAASATLDAGKTTTFTATPNSYHSSGTISASSSDTSVATVSKSGNTYTVTGKSNGTANITVSCTDTGSTDATFTVTVNPASVSAFSYSAVNVGDTASPSVTASNVSGMTASYAVQSGTGVTVNSSTGVITGTAPTTTAKIRVTYNYGSYSVYKDATVTVNTPSLTMNNITGKKVGDTGTFSPASYSNPNSLKGSVSYTIKSGDSITVSGSGYTAVKPGTTTVTATYNYSNNSQTYTCAGVDFTVAVGTPTVSLTAPSKLAIGDAATVSGTSSGSTTTPTWTYAITSGASYASINSTTGVLTGTAAGTVKVKGTANYGNGYTLDTAEKTVTVAAPSLVITDTTNASTQYLTVGTNYSKAMTLNFTPESYNITSSNTSVATASCSGSTLTITPVAKGTSTITVTAIKSGTSPTGLSNLYEKIELAATGASGDITATQTFTVNVTEADTYKYLYFTDGVGWSGVKAYLYGDGNNASFPGEAMVKIGKNEQNKDVYAIRYPATKNYTNVIISNANNSDNRVKMSGNSNLNMPSGNDNAIWADSIENNGNAGYWGCSLTKPQITANNVTIDMGGTQTMTATVLTSGTPSTFNWSSDTTSVATTADTHTATNEISGVAPGTSTITVKAYAEKPSGWNSIVTDGTADDFVAGTTTATATVVAENKTVTFGEKKTDDGTAFTDASGHITAKYYDEDTSSGSGSGSSGSGSSSSGNDAEPSGGPYYLHIGKQNAFTTNTAIQFTWNGSYYYASYNVDTAGADYPFVINTKNTALGDSDKSSSNQSITSLASSNNPDNISMWYTPVYNNNAYFGYDAFKFGVNSGSTGTIYITFTPSGGVVFRTSISSGSSGSGSSSSGSGTGYTGEGTTMTSPQSVPYGKVAVFTAQATYTSGTDTYAFAEWVDGSNNTLSKDLEYVVKITDAKTVYARYYKVFKLSAFDSYEMVNGNVNFVTAPPKTITVKHGDDTYTYSFDGTAPGGHPGTPDDPQATYPDPLPVNSGGTYGQGNYIQYLAGDEVTLIYSAMASSETFKGVFYNNSVEYYLAKPSDEGFIAHDYAAAHTLYMNSAYYDSVPSGLPTTTVDPDAHSIKFTGTQDYKNIDVEVGTKRKVYFSDYTNAIIGSKNVDDYYSDGEALSADGDQLTVKAAKSSTQTNIITADAIKFYKANADGTKGEEVSRATLGITITGTSSTSTASADGDPLVFNGNMPSYDLYIDLNMTNSYTIKLGSKVIADSLENKARLAEVANITITGSTPNLTAPNNADVTNTSASVATGTALTLTTAYTGSWDDYYTFVGWYWGSDSAPDYAKGFISDKLTLNYTPKKGGTIWAVGTRSLYINGSKYITGKDTDWYGENNTQKNLEMSFDAESGRYYWEITDTMFAAAGSNYKTWHENNSSATTEYGRYYDSNSKYYWYDNDSKYHGKSFFQFFDAESGNSDTTIWADISSFLVDYPSGTTPTNPTYGKIYPVGYTGDEYYQRRDGQGFINFNETDYAGQSSPLRIYYNPSATGNARLTVESTKIYSNLYVSNGYTVGSTLKTSAVTVEPVVDGVVKTSGQTGYFSVGQQGTGWNPDVEGHVNHYKPQKKGATVRITKTAGGSDKIVAFFIYDITNKTVRAERDVKKDGSKYYIDLTLANEEQNLYIVPIVEEAGANVTISFDATQLNRKQWGDIVTAYAWYQNNGGAALGDYPGQPMIPSDDMTTWTTTFVGKKGNNELEGITFSNYVDGAHSWLGCSGVMGTVSDHKTGTASGGIVNVYNHVYSGNSGEYARTNFKAQTYDYREPIALYDRFIDVAEEGGQVSISFSMKDGNSSLLSWHHSELLANNILNLPEGWTPLRWEYLTNAKGDKYIDMNGNTMKTKPTASFYVAAKGQVMYGSSNMNYVFYGGKGYDAVTGVNYGAASGVGMNYAVEWYVYDASGKYITNVLTAGIADLASGSSDSYIGKRLEDMGYAVDGKSVAVCYDKPRYMYTDADSGSGATGYNGKRINVGDNFDAYRFTGQWNAVASSELVKVNVGVGMMTDSGEVLATSNTAAYGNAKAYYDTTKGNNTSVTNEDGDNAPFTANDNSFVRTSVRDSKNSPVKLNASAQNFIGWYYYDANTGDFVKANYASNENFYPNYSNKDVTFYAMYRASAVYQYKYVGREGNRTYSASGNDLTAAEMADNNKINPASHEADIIKKVPVGIGVFKKDIDFSTTSYSSWTKTPDSNGYILDITGFSVTNPRYTLTAHYKDANGDFVTVSDSAEYNGKAVNLTAGNYTDSEGHDKPAGTPVTSYCSGFIGWYEYNPTTGDTGDLLSTQANFGMRLSKDQHIIAKYDGSLPSDGWKVFIDENIVNKELTTSTTGVYYNDTIVRVRNGSDVKVDLTEYANSKIGVLVVCDNKTNQTINGYNQTQLETLVGSIDSGKTKKTAKGLSITNMQANTQTEFNRTDIAVRADYAKTLGAKYCVYAYFYDGSAYHFSAVSDVKTYE